MRRNTYTPSTASAPATSDPTALKLLKQTLLLFVFATFLNATSLQASTATDIKGTLTATQHSEKQGNLYRQTLTAIRKGHKTKSRHGLEALKDYPLYPYLVKAQLQKRLKQLPYKDVDQFLLTYRDSVAAKQLRKKWLKVLASKKIWPQYTHYYRQNIANSELQCLFIEGLHQTQHPQLALRLTTDSWLSAKSKPDACDPVFKRWQHAGYQTDDLVWRRSKMALQGNNTQLARYLSKHASAQLKPYTRRLISVHRRPQRLATQADFIDSSDYNTDIVTHGLLKLAAKDADLATRLWVDYRGSLAFNSQQQHDIRNKIARQVIASGSDKALDWLIIHDPNAEDSYLLEWRIRLALKNQHWTQAQQWIAILPSDLQQQPRWQYWLARAEQSTANPLAQQRLETLAAQRNYYGFLAADILNRNYDFNHRQLSTAEPAQAIKHIPQIQRAKVFYQLGELTPARREWFNATSHFDQQQLIAATSLAHRWGWHQQAIHTTIKAKQWDDLAIRFPLAYQNAMTDSANSATIRLEWLYAIARQESAFAQDAQSSIGARGLLQLRPGTAKQVARKIGVKYKTQDLLQADKNIILGSNYLKQLLGDFEGNHILATAAYNAGPYRVKKWLKNQPSTLPYDIWIETLPFHETRNYVQNVLAFSVIYGHRLGLSSPLIGQTELTIGNSLKRP